MSKNIILDLCGGSGAWSRPYLLAGYNCKALVEIAANNFFACGTVQVKRKGRE